MNEITLDDTVVHTGPVLSADTGTEILALDERSGNCFSFSGSGRIIWECARKPIRVRDICTRLRQRYRVDEVTCISETLAYLNILLSENLVRVDAPKKHG